jgi:hypothetical protein
LTYDPARKYAPDLANGDGLCNAPVDCAFTAAAPFEMCLLDASLASPFVPWTELRVDADLSDMKFYGRPLPEARKTRLGRDKRMK